MTDAKAAPTKTAASSTSRDLLITRVFDAPRDLVWKVWTEPQHLQAWWGPKHFTAPTINIDFRVGGTYLYCMKAPDGQEFWSTGVFREIVPEERIVCTDAFSDPQGNAVAASYYSMPGDWPEETVITVTFEEESTGKTKLTLRHQGIPVGEMGDMTEAGWNESLDKFAVALRS